MSRGVGCLQPVGGSWEGVGVSVVGGRVHRGRAGVTGYRWLAECKYVAAFGSEV